MNQEQENKLFEKESREMHAFFKAHRNAWKPSREFAERLVRILPDTSRKPQFAPHVWRWVFAVPVGAIAILLLLRITNPQQPSPTPSLLEEHATQPAAGAPLAPFSTLKNGATTPQGDAVHSPLEMQAPAPMPRAAFEVFFTKNSKKSCTAVFPLPRTIAFTGDVDLKSMIEALITGPINEERNRGFGTSLDPATIVETLIVREGNIVDVVLKEPAELPPHTACDLTRIRTQIEATLRQFPGADIVHISLNGRSIP